MTDLDHDLYFFENSFLINEKCVYTINANTIIELVLFSEKFLKVNRISTSIPLIFILIRFLSKTMMDIISK